MADDYKVPGNTNVEPPTNEDMYKRAAKETTDWTSKVDPTPEATDHLEYHKDPTKRPKTYDDDGVTPPTNHDIYVDGVDEVAAWPENSLDDSTVAAEEQAEADKNL